MHVELTRLLGNQSERLYPWHLAKEHPRIIERIVELWNQGSALGTYLDDLLVDNRGNRKGFSPPILMEILTLKNHYMSLKRQPERSVDTWGELTDIGEVVHRS
jgi:hypothetical protein